MILPKVKYWVNSGVSARGEKLIVNSKFQVIFPCTKFCSVNQVN